MMARPFQWTRAQSISSQWNDVEDWLSYYVFGDVFRERGHPSMLYIVTMHRDVPIPDSLTGYVSGVVLRMATLAKAALVGCDSMV